jgi:hypothetical protein
MNLTTVEDALTDAIEYWMRCDEPEYAHGRAQGLAHALMLLRSTTFQDEWVAGLDRYQNRIVMGDDRP